MTLRSKVSIHRPGDGLQPEAERHADARIDPAHQARGHEADRHADAAAADHLADQRVGKADMLLQQRRQQHHRGEVQHAVDRHQHEADRIVAVGQQLQVQERRRGGEAVEQEHVERDRRDQALDDDLGRLRTSRAARRARARAASRRARSTSAMKPVQSNRDLRGRAVARAASAACRSAPRRRPAPACRTPSASCRPRRDSRRGSGRTPARPRPPCRTARAPSGAGGAGTC